MRRFRVLALGAFGALSIPVIVAACADDSSTATATSPTIPTGTPTTTATGPATPTPLPVVPDSGKSIFPGYGTAALDSTTTKATCSATPNPGIVPLDGGSVAASCPDVAPAGGAFDWRDSVMYFTFVDRFYNGNPANDQSLLEGADEPGDWQGGDWAGVTKRIEDGYFRALGVNTLWVTVPFDNPDSYASPKDPAAPLTSGGAHTFTGYHGYWPLDQWPEGGTKRTEPRFGTEQELVQLVQVAHANGIKVLFDYAMVHVHISSPLWTEHAPVVTQGTLQKDAKGLILDATGKPAWFWPNLALDKNLAPLTSPADGGAPLSCECGTAWCSYDILPNNPTVNQRCWFTGYLPHWNYTVPEALAYSLDSAVRLVRDTGVDGFRLDAVKHIPPAWYKGLRERLTAELAKTGSPQRFYLVGETYDFGNRDYIKSFIDPKTSLDGQFDFPYRAKVVSAMLARSAADPSDIQDMRSLATFLTANDTFYGCDAVMSPFLGNHDIGRVIHVAEDPPKWNEYSNGGDYAWQSPPAVPVAVAPFERLAAAFTLLFTGPGAPLIYYGDEFALPGGGDPDNRRMLFDKNGNVTLTENQVALYNRVRALTAIRAAHPALRHGVRKTLEAGADLWAFSMTSKEETVYVVVNRSDAPLSTCTLPEGNLRELVGNVTLAGPGVTIPARQARIFVATP